MAGNVKVTVIATGFDRLERDLADIDREEEPKPLTVGSKPLRPPFLRGDDSGGFGPNASLAGRLRHPDGAAPADGLNVASGLREASAPCGAHRRAGSPGCRLDRSPDPSPRLRLPRRAPPPSLRSGDFARRERMIPQRLARS